MIEETCARAWGGNAARQSNSYRTGWHSAEASSRNQSVSETNRGSSTLLVVPLLSAQAQVATAAPAQPLLPLLNSFLRLRVRPVLPLVTEGSGDDSSLPVIRLCSGLSRCRLGDALRAVLGVPRPTAGEGGATRNSLQRKRRAQAVYGATLPLPASSLEPALASVRAMLQ